MTTVEPPAAPKEKKEPWGRLASLNPKWPTIEIFEDSFIIGRNCAVLGIKNTAISGSHFKLWREASGIENQWIFFIMDTSTNGTFLNTNERLVKNRRQVIESGTDVSMLNPKKNVDSVTWTFLDLASERGEEQPRSKYELLEVLGTGNFATVRLVRELSTGTRYAMKVIEKRKFHTSTSRKDALMDEVKVLLAVSHANLIYLHEFFDTEKRMYLVLELITGGELFDSIVEKGHFSEPRSKEVMKQCLEAIAYLHSRGIAHRDLKPENILLADRSENSAVKISDFGLSRVIDQDSFMKTMCGTPQYVAPEVLVGNPAGYGKEVDIWSLGVIMYVMMSGFQPFEDENNRSNELFEKIKRGTFTYPSPYFDEVSSDAKDLINHMIVVDPLQRYTAAQALQHRWFVGSKIQQSVIMTDVSSAITSSPVGAVATAPAAAAPHDVLMTAVSCGAMDIAQSMMVTSHQQAPPAPQVAPQPQPPQAAQKAAAGLAGFSVMDVVPAAPFTAARLASPPQQKASLFCCTLPSDSDATKKRLEIPEDPDSTDRKRKK